jgi:GGDEF domain-containing protein
MSPGPAKRTHPDPHEDTRRAIAVLLRRVAENALRADETDHADLTMTLQRVERDLPEMNSAELLTSAVEVLRTLDSFNQRTVEFLRRQRTKFKGLLSFLISAIPEFQADTANKDVLDDIRRQIAQVNGIEDLENVETRLRSYVLEMYAVTSRTHRKESGHDPGPAASLNLDPITRLPGRAAAEAAMMEAVSGSRKKYIGVVVLSQLQSINARYGNAVGDQVLAELAHEIQAGLWVSDSLYRWSGPALLAVMDRDVDINRLRTNVKPLFGRSIDKPFDVGGKDVLIPVAPAWNVFGLIRPLSIIMKRIDMFVAGQRSKEEA